MSPDARASQTVEIDGRAVKLTNLDKVLYPEDGFTKGEILDYYARVAPVMLPHLTDRPVTFIRYPDGVDTSGFFAKHAPAHRPSWIRTADIAATSSGKKVEYVLIDDLSSLMWAANLAAIEFHVPLWHARRGPLPARPDHLVFDLDPGPGTSIVECCRVAGWIAERLDGRGRGPVAKASGSKGLQVYVRLSQRAEWGPARERALRVAEAVRAEHPELVVTNMKKEHRHGKVLIDWSQNHPAKTTVAVYSLRGGPEPSVSAPVTWDEVADCERTGDPGRLRFGPGEVLDRVHRMGDLFEDLL